MASGGPHEQGRPVQYLNVNLNDGSNPRAWANITHCVMLNCHRFPTEVPKGGKGHLVAERSGLMGSAVASVLPAVVDCRERYASQLLLASGTVLLTGFEEGPLPWRQREEGT